MEARIRPFGEAALLVELADAPDLATNSRVHALAAALAETSLNVIPGYVSLLVELDPLGADPESVERLVRERLARISASTAVSTGRRRTIPTVYGGEWGPDLEDVAARLRLSPAAVIARHTQQELTVYMLGFSPGFPYLGDLPAELALPRRDQPRERVPVGSVAIAERQTGIYSRETPGGWHLLGRTPIVLFDEQRTPPAYLAPGDHVRFVAIAAEAWDAYAAPPADW